MIQNVVETIGGIGGYGVISVCLFFIVFLGAMIWAMTRDRSICRRLSALPLENDEPASQGDSHE